MLRPPHLVAAAQKVTHRLILRLRHMDVFEFASAVKTRQLVRITAVGLHPIPRPAWHARGTHHNALMAQPADEPTERKTARAGFVT